MAPPPFSSSPAGCLRHSTALMTLAAALLTVVLFSNAVSSQNVVENLPGYTGKLPFRLETGYIGVGDKEEVQFFYYFIESENEPEDDPLMLWLTGGPGCSALSGLLYEIGPISIDIANSEGTVIPKLILNDYSWTKVANIIFLDQPVGTGFSYANTSKAFYSNDTSSAKLTYDFLRKWLINHPKYIENPLYISADSYGGLIATLVVNEVYNGIEEGITPMMNIKGYTQGNAMADTFVDINSRAQYAHRMGLLSDRLYQSAETHCQANFVQVDPHNHLCISDIQRIDECLGKICQTHITEPACGGLWRKKSNILSQRTPSLQETNPADFLVSPATKSWCRDNTYIFSHTWANDKSVQRALHIRENTITEWVRCNHSIQHAEAGPSGDIPYTSDVQSVVHYHDHFTRKSCRALIYSGDHDLLIPHLATQKWIESLELPVQSDWRPWFVESQVAGYAIRYGQSDYELTFATVKGGGHTAPEHKPAECFAMIDRWFRQSPL